MNPYTLFILSALLLRFALDVVSNWLNLRGLQSNLPRELDGLYDGEQYRHSQEYTRAKTRFGLVESTFDLILFLAFWFLGGFPWLDSHVRSLGLAPLWTGILYIAALAAGGAILSLPFQIYFTFVIEERYGFNRTTRGLFVKDRIKGLALVSVLGGPLLALILLLFDQAGEHAWLWCWMAATLFLLGVQFVAPAWILPLFNKYTPLPEGELRQAIRDYAGRVRFSFQDIYVMDGSKRSTHANAFFTGFGRNKRIALFDTLVEQHTLPEILAVLAHEIGHYKKYHVPKMTAIGILQTGFLLFLLSVFIGNETLFAAFGMKEVSVYAGLVFFGFLYEPVSFLLSIGMNVLSRKHEFDADRYACETGQDPQNLISSLKKLSVKNLTNLTPHPVYAFLHHSHPPLLERIRALGSPQSFSCVGGHIRNNEKSRQ